MPRDGGGLRRGRRPDGSEDCRRSWRKKKVAQRNGFGERKRSQSKKVAQGQEPLSQGLFRLFGNAERRFEGCSVQSQLVLNNENGCASERSALECAKILRLCKQELLDCRGSERPRCFRY